MTLFAIASELTAVNIRVAVRADLGSVGKSEPDVTLAAIQRHMQSPERVSGLIVIELRGGADGIPARRRMTICTGDPQRVMRTAGAPPLVLSLVRASVGQ